MTAIPAVDIEAELAEQVAAVSATGGEVMIVGGGTKTFYGEPIEALPLEVAGHSGVIDYDPAELVITLRAGCRLAEVEALLAENRQMFGFEPPHFGAGATIGGMIASGLAGPRRAYAGSVRDFVLGARLLDGRGEALNFGGRVIKNVAGFDIARSLVGSLGTLGVILEASIRVIPAYQQEITLAFEHARAADHVKWINELGSEPWPISASAWCDGQSLLRLSGSEQGVAEARAQLGGEIVDSPWQALREQSHPFFDGDEDLTRVAVPPASGDLDFDLPQLIEWGGAQRWLRGDLKIASLRKRIEPHGGNACAWRGHSGEPRFQPLPAELLKLQRSIKSSFDPALIFNRGRLFTRR